MLFSSAMSVGSRSSALRLRGEVAAMCRVMSLTSVLKDSFLVVSSLPVVTFKRTPTLPPM